MKTELDQLHVEEKKRENLIKKLCERVSGAPYALECVGNDDGTLINVVIALADPYISKDDVPELLDRLQAGFIKYMGDKYENECQAAVSADYTANEEYRIGAA
jgi:hypothetical protein